MPIDHNWKVNSKFQVGDKVKVTSNPTWAGHKQKAPQVGEVYTVSRIFSDEVACLDPSQHSLWYVDFTCIEKHEPGPDQEAIDAAIRSITGGA